MTLRTDYVAGEKLFAEDYNALSVLVNAVAALSDTNAAAITGLLSAMAGAEVFTNKGIANGYASLDSAGKVPVSQLPSSIMEYQGTWDALTNTPTLADGTGNRGDVYRVTAENGRNLGSGAIDFKVGDYVIYNGSTWEKSDTTDAVASVAGLAGVITAVALKAALALSNVDNTADAVKSVLSATKLATARQINGVAFDGTANITVTDSTKLDKTSSPGQLYGTDSSGNQTTRGLTATAAASSVAFRDANGRSQFADPSASADAATKNYVDTTKADAQTVLAGRVGKSTPINTHPESSGFQIIPKLFNDLAYNTARGGSHTVTVNGSPGSTSGNSMYSPSSFNSISVAASSDVIVIEVIMWNLFQYGTYYGIQMNDTFCARDVKIEVYDNSSWVTIYNVTGASVGSAGSGLHWKQYAGTSTSQTRVRYTLTNFSPNAVGTAVRISSLFAINYNSPLASALFVPRDGGVLYGPIQHPGYASGSRPSASAAGAEIYDTGSKKLLVADGSKWKALTHRADLISANYYWCNSGGNSAANATGGFGVLRVTPWFVEAPVTLAKLVGEVTNAGGAGTTIRLGIYADNGSGQPGALVIDAGTIDGTSATVQEVTASVTLQPGLYWVGGAPQGSGTQPGVRGVGAGIVDCDWGVSLGTSLPAAGTNVYGFQKTGVTAALPDPFASTTTTTSAIRVGFKVA